MTVKQVSKNLLRGAKVETWDGHIVTVMQKFKRPYVLVLSEKGLYTLTENMIRRIVK